MAIVGTAVYALTPSRLQRYVDSLAPIVVGILIMVPPYYEANPSDRPLYTSFKRLLPFQVQLADSKNRSILGPQLSELTSYLRLDASDNKILDYNIFQSWQTQESLQHFLDRERINVVFLRPDIMRELKKRPEGAQLFDNPVEFGWQKLAPAQSKSAWMLLYRAPLP